MRTKRRKNEPWPPEWAQLPNLDELERISRGEGVEPDDQQPDDTGTVARCQLKLLPIGLECAK